MITKHKIYTPSRALEPHVVGNSVVQKLSFRAKTLPANSIPKLEIQPSVNQDKRVRSCFNLRLFEPADAWTSAKTSFGFRSATKMLNLELLLAMLARYCSALLRAVTFVMLLMVVWRGGDWASSGIKKIDFERLFSAGQGKGKKKLTAFCMAKMLIRICLSQKHLNLT